MDPIEAGIQCMLDDDENEALMDAFGTDVELVMWVVEVEGTIDSFMCELVFRKKGFKAEFIETMIENVIPISRGGRAAGLEAEQRWEDWVDDKLAEYGEDYFDESRRKFREIIEETEEQTDGDKELEAARPKAA